MLKNIDYEKVIEAICYVKGIKRCDLLKILKNKEFKYILLLLLKKYKCDDVDKTYKNFLIFSDRTIKYGSKKAEQRLFINKEFREMYFEIENKLMK